MKSIFLSCENSADPGFASLKRSLMNLGLPVTSSPSPEDERWHDWQQAGCGRQLGSFDIFVAVVTEGYDGSTWMAHELETAWKLSQETGKPTLFAFRVVQRPLPAGFKCYAPALRELPAEAEAAARVLAAGGW